MTARTARLGLEGDGLRFAASTGSGHQLILDDAAGDAGPRPAELLLVSLAGCAAMDVASILRKKRQVVDRYEVRIHGVQRDALHPHVFERIDVLHVIAGSSIDPEAVRRAIELSATRYCTVGSNLAAGVAEIHHAYLIQETGCAADGEERFAEVVVIGPYAQIADGSPELEAGAESRRATRERAGDSVAHALPRAR